MLFIYLHMSSHQRVLTFHLSNSFASCTDLGILTPKLCVLIQYFESRCPMIRLRFTFTYWTHHAKAGSPAIQRCTAYLTICTGFDFFISLRVTHVVLPSFYWTRTSNPLFVSLQCFVPVCVTMNSFWWFTSVPSYLWLKIYWNRTCRFPSPSNWANMLSTIALAAC